MAARSHADLRGSPLLALAPLRLEALAVRCGAPGAKVLRIGAGARHARASADRLRAVYLPRTAALVLTGVAGALVEGLDPGDLVIADRVLDGSGATVALLPNAALLAAHLHGAGLPVRVGPVMSVERLVRGPSRAALAASGALAVDMESASVLREPWGRPIAVVRAVADTPRRELFSAQTIGGGVAALRALHCAAPRLVEWAATVIAEDRSTGSSTLASSLPPEVR